MKKTNYTHATVCSELNNIAQEAKRLERRLEIQEVMEDNSSVPAAMKMLNLAAIRV